jgi:hypothetical protein
MNRLLYLLLGLVLMASCKNRKPDISGEEPIEITDFIASFPDVVLPYSVTDTGIIRKLGDSMKINAKIVKQFVPDSVYANEFAKGSSPLFYMLGKTAVKGGESYLFLKVVAGGKAVGYVLSYDKDNFFRAAMPFIFSSGDRNIRYEGGMDRRHSVTRNRIRTGKDGQLIYNKNVYVYNSAGTFTQIMNESNEPVEVKEVYNPIDTLPTKFSRSGDYVKNKKNFVSVRDGNKTSQLIFFIHFEENETDCDGELKGVADLIKPNVALYRKSDDHCELEFTFSNTGVKIRELQACGNHRGVKCSFDGSYTKRKPVKAKSKK